MFFFGKSESRSIYWSISIVPSGFCCGYHQCFFLGKSVSIRLLQSLLVGIHRIPEKKNECRIDASQNLTKHKKDYLYRFIDEAATEWTNGISQMCPELLSNGLFHSARKNIFQFTNVVMFFTAVFPSTLDPEVDIANILWAFAKLKVDEGERLRPLLQQAEEQLDSYLGLRIRSRPRGMRSLVHGTKDNGGNMGFSWEHDFSTNMLKMPRHAPFYGYIHAEGDQPTLSMRFWGTLGLDFHMLNWPVRHVVDGSWMPFLGCCEFIGSPFFRRSGDFFSFRTGIL